MAQNSYAWLFSLVVLKKKKKRGKEIHISKGLDLSAAGKPVVKFMKVFYQAKVSRTYSHTCHLKLDIFVLQVIIKLLYVHCGKLEKCQNIKDKNKSFIISLFREQIFNINI